MNMPTSPENTPSVVTSTDTPPRPARPDNGLILSRATRLLCPRCGGEKLFKGWFQMHDQCGQCRMKYERAPGYFLGSSYINYGMTALSLTFGFILLKFFFHLSNESLAIPLSLYCIIFPMLLFRHARSYWLALDCIFDESILAESIPVESEAPLDEPKSSQTM
ncbi:MAG: DUF983 domain-containing protein [Planctomycetaceae bacterium]